MKDTETILIKSENCAVLQINNVRACTWNLQDLALNFCYLPYIIGQTSYTSDTYRLSQSVSSQIYFVMSFESSIWIKYCILWSSCKVLPISTKLQLETIFFLMEKDTTGPVPVI